MSYLQAKKPSDFLNMDQYKIYTGQLFLKKFKIFVNEFSNYGGEELLTDKDKAMLLEMASSTLATHGRDLRSWLALQVFQQFLPGEQTPRHLDQITTIALSQYSKFASYEVHDDLPILDNDEYRRGAPSVWKKHGAANALLFANMLSTFSNHLIHDGDYSQDIKLRLARELDFADARILFGQTVQLGVDQFNDTQALAITLKSHLTKTASFNGFIASAAALIAGADEEVVGMMREFGIAYGRCGQISNDAHIDDVRKDMEMGAPNIVAAAGCGNIGIGIAQTKNLFEIYMARARKIVGSLAGDTKALSEMLADTQNAFQKKFAITAGSIRHQASL